MQHKHSMAAFMVAISLSALAPALANDARRAPNPFATPETIINDLKTVQQHITQTFDQLVKDFKASATPKVNQIVTNETQKQFTTLKQALRDLPNVINDQFAQAQGNELSQQLLTISVGIINAIQAIDGNLQAYFDAFPNSESYKEILDESIQKLQALEKKAASIQRMKKGQGLQTVSSAGGIVMNIAKTAREKTLQVIDLVKVPKKSKNPIKRLFGK